MIRRSWFGPGMSGGRLWGANGYGVGACVPPCSFAFAQGARGIGKADAEGSVGKENQAGIADDCKII